MMISEIFILHQFLILIWRIFPYRDKIRLPEICEDLVIILNSGLFRNWFFGNNIFVVAGRRQ